MRFVTTVATGGRGIFFLLLNFFQKRLQKVMYFPSNLRTFCVISFTDSADVGVYCENLRIYCVCNILYK